MLYNNYCQKGILKMTRSKLLILGTIPAMLLCGCAKKCSFEEFAKAVDSIEIVEDDKIEKISVKGTVEFSGKEYSVDKTFNEKTSIIGLSMAEGAALMLMTVNHVSVYAVAENKDAVYYAGSTFKVEFPAVTYEFDKYGMCTKIKGETTEEKISYKVDLKASYSYK